MINGNDAQINWRYDMNKQQQRLDDLWNRVDRLTNALYNMTESQHDSPLFRPCIAALTKQSNRYGDLAIELGEWVMIR